MKLLKLSLLASASLLSGILTFAQTADEIVAKHIDAIGGKDKISSIKSIYTETTSQVMGNEAPGSMTVLNGKGLRIETEFNGSKIIQCFTDKGGWSTNPMAGSSTPTPMPDEQYKAGKAQMDIGGELFNYADKGSKVTLVGKEGNLYNIKLTTKDSSETNYFIDPATYYITKMVKSGVMMGQQVEVTTTYSDYKKTEYGYTIPYTIQIEFGTMFSLSTAIKKIEVNKAVDPKIFEMPK